MGFLNKLKNNLANLNLGEDDNSIDDYNENWDELNDESDSYNSAISRQKSEISAHFKDVGAELKGVVGTAFGGFGFKKKKKNEDADIPESRVEDPEEKADGQSKTGIVVSKVIGYVSSINYDKTLDAINSLDGDYSTTTELIVVLRDASARYKESDSEDKNKEFLRAFRNVNAECVLDELKPVSENIPSGKYIVMLLKFLIKRQKKKAAKKK